MPSFFLLLKYTNITIILGGEGGDIYDGKVYK
ncbi:hypothetical protein IE3_04290 [Bacillus cereus BAG3X2-1]|nr:hypothetical protein IE3_04290 [Bacillus cereus BAG3X2-1]